MRSERRRIPRARARRRWVPFGILACVVLLAPTVGAADVPDHWNLGSLGATADLVDERVVVQTVLLMLHTTGKPRLVCLGGKARKR